MLRPQLSRGWLKLVSGGWAADGREGRSRAGRRTYGGIGRFLGFLPDFFVGERGGRPHAAQEEEKFFLFLLRGAKAEGGRREGKRAKLIKKSRQDPSLPALSFSLPHQERKMGGWALQDQNEWEQKTSV